MVPRQSPRGTSFKGAALYYLHDKDALTSERVDFTHTENLPTSDPEKAWRWMAYTAMSAEKLKAANGATTRGRKSTKPVFTFSLSWHPEEEPERDHMVMTGRSALAALGLIEHQALMVAHRDEAYKHLHLMVNVVHPETGRSHTMDFTKLDLSKWAEEYERVHGKIYCDLRVENNEKRRENKKRRDEERGASSDKKIKGENVYYKDPYDEKRKQIAKLYREAKDGQAFRAAVEKAGYKLAQGRKILLVDAEGKEHSLARVIGGGVKEKHVRETLRGLDLQQIAEAKAQQEKAKLEAERRKAEEEERKKRESALASQKQEREGEATPQQNRAARLPERMPARTLAERAAQKPDGYIGPPVPAKINRIEDRQREEIIKFHDTTQMIKKRYKRETARKFSGKEEWLRQEIEAGEKELQEAGAVQRLWQSARGALKEKQERLEEMKRELAGIEDFKGARQGRDEFEAREHAKGLKDLQKRHEQERTALWDNPKATLETGQAFNKRSAPEREPDAERPLVELPEALQERISETAQRTWPRRSREDQIRETAQADRQQEPGMKTEETARQKAAGPEAQKFNRVAEGESESAPHYCVQALNGNCHLLIRPHHLHTDRKTSLAGKIRVLLALFHDSILSPA